MQKTSKLLWSCIAGISAMVCFGAMDANAARSMTGAGGMSAGGRTIARMPTMPTMSINTIGTHSASGGSTEVITTGGTDEPGGNVTPSGECLDGGVRNSTFTVDDCMQSLLLCIQGGALPNGLNDLFNEDLRNSVIRGMNLCAPQVEQCVSQVREDCVNLYGAASDVWADFNSRVVQPEYYGFVLRKTGLTPNQAETVCALLDKNTYGKSFAAVSGSNAVTSEYNRPVGAYNRQNNGTLSKANPLGPTINTTANGNTGVDGERGHYTRWDPATAECKIRVAAYNKDKLITNKWLFGAVGDDKAAEVWQDVGSTFTCNKDLFDFSLMNNTKTAAVVGVGGGTLLGAGIGAAAGHGKRVFDCSNKSMRDELWKEIASSGHQRTLNAYIGLSEGEALTTLDQAKCEKIVDVYDRYEKAIRARDICQKSMSSCEIKYRLSADNTTLESYTATFTDCSQVNAVIFNGNRVTIPGVLHDGQDLVVDTSHNSEAFALCKQACRNKASGPIILECEFTTLKNGGEGAIDGEIPGVCTGGNSPCVSRNGIDAQIAELTGVFDKVTVVKGQESNRWKTTLIGAGVGAGAGGVATAITAFVEKNNIACHVGDGLETIGLGKSYTIDTLKDFYIKWNLRIADSITPTTKITSCAEWISTCNMYTNADECNVVEINYQRPTRTTSTLIRSACVWSDADNKCNENRPVAVSYGACAPDTPDEPDNPGNGGTTTVITNDPSIIHHK